MGFGKTIGAEAAAKLGHENAGGGVVDFPEGGEDGFRFGVTAEEVGGNSGDF